MAAVRLGAVDDTVFKLNHKDEQENYDNAWNEILGVMYARDSKIIFGNPPQCFRENEKQNEFIFNELSIVLRKKFNRNAAYATASYESH